MALLKIGFLIIAILLVLFGIWILMYFMGLAFGKRFQDIRATRKMIKFMKKSEDFSKLYSFARSRDIEFRIFLSYVGGWAAFSVPHKKNAVGLGIFGHQTVYNPLFQVRGKMAFAHEIAHIEYWVHRENLTCLFQTRYVYTKYNFECFWEEWWAWLRGKVILDTLKINIKENEYWHEAMRCVPHHRACPLWEKNCCPKASVIRKIEERIKSLDLPIGEAGKRGTFIF